MDSDDSDCEAIDQQIELWKTKLKEVGKQIKQLEQQQNFVPLLIED